MNESSRLQQGAVILEARGISKSYETAASPSGLFLERIFGLKGRRETFQALKPLDLDIKIGSSVGILGRNGAGKSTLLNVLSGNTAPTTGAISAYGRIAALIGVGQSFNIEETGRSNARRFCRVHGLSPEETKAAVERIHDFSELGAHFDRAVKTYSSGMKARLNFSCATFVKADLIIVDEVLAVGDAEFRSKCYGFIEASLEAGQTYVMVSHSPAVIGNYCDRALVLNDGELIFDGDPLGGMQAYQGLISVRAQKRRSAEELARMRLAHGGDVREKAAVTLRDVRYAPDQGETQTDNLALITSEGVGRLTAVFEILSEINSPRVAFGLRSSKGIMLSSASHAFKDAAWKPGEIRHVTFEFSLRLAVGAYLLRVSVHDISEGEKNLIFDREGAIELRFISGVRDGIVDLGLKLVETKVETSKIEEARQELQAP